MKAAGNLCREIAIARNGLDEATDAAEQALRQFEGPGGFDAPMAAHIVTATK